MAKQTVFATDTNVIMQRSKYAYRDLTRPDGHSSGVVYGTITSIAALLSRFKPDVFIPTFDVGKSKHRTELYEEYKGNRGKKELPLINQFAATRGFLELIGFEPYYEENVEADDLLAALSIKHSKNKEITICTQDHDLFQLISDNVSIFRPKLGNRPEQLVSKDDYMLEIGMHPERLPELWAMTGDDGDNIPGVPGVGWKTAKKFFVKHGSLFHAIAKEPKLQQYADMCSLNYKLIKLDGTVASKKPSFKTVEEVLDTAYGKEDVVDFLEQWGMHSLLRRYIEGTLFEI